MTAKKTTTTQEYLEEIWTTANASIKGALSLEILDTNTYLKAAHVVKTRTKTAQSRQGVYYLFNVWVFCCIRSHVEKESIAPALESMFEDTELIKISTVKQFAEELMYLALVRKHLEQDPSEVALNLLASLGVIVSLAKLAGVSLESLASQHKKAKLQLCLK